MTRRSAASLRSACLAFVFSLGILSSCFLAEEVLATPINRGSFVGNTVTYVDVTEDSATDPGLVTPGPLGGLFGEPTVAGDSLDFNPKNFAAAASGAGGIDNTDANLQFMVVANPGKGINGLGLSEAGDTIIAGLVGNAYTQVTATIFIEINALDGVAIPAINIPAASMLFSPSGGDYELAVDGSGPGSYAFDFAGSIYVDFGPYVPFGRSATKISVSLDNTLLAISQAGSTAFIQKKDFDGISVTVDTNDIPEPTTALMALLGLVSLACQRRK